MRKKRHTHKKKPNKNKQTNNIAIILPPIKLINGIYFGSTSIYTTQPTDFYYNNKNSFDVCARPHMLYAQIDTHS